MSVSMDMRIMAAAEEGLADARSIPAHHLRTPSSSPSRGAPMRSPSGRPQPGFELIDQLRLRTRGGMPHG